VGRRIQGPVGVGGVIGHVRVCGWKVKSGRWDVVGVVVVVGTVVIRGRCVPVVGSGVVE